MGDRAGRGALGCLATVVVLVALLYAGVQLGPPWLHYQQYRDEMRTQARFGRSLPDSTIRARLIAHADSLHLPAAAKRITITRHHGQFPTITIRAEYEEAVTFIFLGTRMLRFEPMIEESL